MWQKTTNTKQKTQKKPCSGAHGHTCFVTSTPQPTLLVCWRVDHVNSTCPYICWLWFGDSADARDSIKYAKESFERGSVRGRLLSEALIIFIRGGVVLFVRFDAWNYGDVDPVTTCGVPRFLTVDSKCCKTKHRIQRIKAAVEFVGPVSYLVIPLCVSTDRTKWDRWAFP